MTHTCQAITTPARERIWFSPACIKPEAELF